MFAKVCVHKSIAMRLGCPHSSLGSVRIRWRGEDGLKFKGKEKGLELEIRDFPFYYLFFIKSDAISSQ